MIIKYLTVRCCRLLCSKNINETKRNHDTAFLLLILILMFWNTLKILICLKLGNDRKVRLFMLQALKTISVYNVK